MHLSLERLTVVPHLPVAVESAIAVSIEVDPVATQIPSRRLVLEANGKRLAEPVVHVGAPEHCPLNFYIDIFQTRRVHHCADIIRRILEYNMAIFLAIGKGL